MREDVDVDGEEAARVHAKLDAERRFIDERGGQSWIDTYIRPYYRTWMGLGPTLRTDAQELIPGIRARAGELSIADISAMVLMQWRIQVMGAWYAIARADNAFEQPVHQAFGFCYGSLTAPALTTAVLTYRGPSTSDVLRAYGDRDAIHRYGGAGIIAAALRRCESRLDEGAHNDDDEKLDALLTVARSLQGDAT